MSFQKQLGTILVAAAVLIAASPAVASPVSGQGTWESTLQARDLDGDSVIDAFYDTALDVTWLANANANGEMVWPDANTWAANLVVGIYDDWRLPTISDTGTPGCNFSYAGGTDCGFNVDTGGSEMAHLWYLTLGNKAICPPGDANCAGEQPNGWGLTNTGNFSGMQSNGYWFGLEVAPYTRDAWFFHTEIGYQGDVYKERERIYAMAVRPGDVVAVPEPESLLLMLAGLCALVVLRRRQPLGHSAL